MTNSMTCPNCGDVIRGRFCTSCGARSDGYASNGNLNMVVSRDPDKTSMMNSAALQDLLAQPQVGNVAAQTQVMSPGFEPEQPDGVNAEDVGLATDVVHQDDPSLLTDVLPRDVAPEQPETVSDPDDKPGVLTRFLSWMFPSLMERRNHRAQS